MRRSRGLVLLVAVVCWLAGCGGKVTSGSATGLDGTLPLGKTPSVPMSALGGACVADVDCDASAFCSLADRGASCGTCAPRLPDGAACDLDPYRPVQSCGQGARCIGDVSGYPQTGICTRITYVGEGTACDSTTPPPYGGDVPPAQQPNAVACADPLTCIAGTCGLAGSRPVGGACDQDYDCVGGLYCSSSSSSEPSVCAPRLPASATCDRDGACLSGLCCSYGPCAGETFRCIEPAGLGEPCFGGDWCKPGLSCNDTEGVCVTQPTLGEPCDPTAGDVVCIDGTECDATTRSCVAQPAQKTGSLGDACDGSGGSCVEGLACSAGTCTSATDYCAPPARVSAGAP